VVAGNRIIAKETQAVSLWTIEQVEPQATVRLSQDIVPIRAASGLTGEPPAPRRRKAQPGDAKSNDTMRNQRQLSLALGFLLPFANGRVSAQYQYPFQNPDQPLEERVNNVVSLMTLDEKIACLSSRPGVPRLGIRNMGHCEGLHGMAQGGPSNWGRRNPAPTTTFPQAYGMGETWPELTRKGREQLT